MSYVFSLYAALFALKGVSTNIIDIVSFMWFILEFFLKQRFYLTTHSTHFIYG